ncbi:MAG: hypothetical protein F7B11_05495 [Caldisphaeraceae archaeon]|nr:hypothetical protein [Caldisphaeraceae archaeon]
MTTFKKLLKFIDGNPSYEYIIDESNNTIEVFFSAPSLQEASGIGSGFQSETIMHITLKRKPNDEIEVISANIEGSNTQREIAKDEIQWWLDQIDEII